MTQNISEPRRSSLISAYGGELKDLVRVGPEADDLRAYSRSLPFLRLSMRGECDLELLATGAFSPLDRFMNGADYRSVVDTMRLSSGHVFPVPVTLPVEAALDARIGSDVTLCDKANNPLALMTVEEVFEWDKREFANQILGTESVRHPLVTEIGAWGERFISGPLRVFDLPSHYDFPELRLSPREVRQRLSAMQNPNVVAFQTRNPLHRAHEEITKQAIQRTGATLLVHPVVGLTKPGDVSHHSRVRSYKILLERYYDRDRVLLALVALAMRFAGPREAVWHALIRRNFGANHFIVGRDHASPGADENGKPFYAPRSAIELVESFSKELEVDVIPFEEFVYLPETGIYEERSRVTDGKTFLSLSGTEVRNDFLNEGRRLPEWFARPEVADILEDSYLPRHRQGICIWFTGLSGSGKSTTAEILTEMLSAYGRRVTLLDGDVVRTNLSAGLGFDRDGRDANIRRIGYVGSEIVRHGGVAICAAISPYRETRNEVRQLIGDNFIEVYVDTPLNVCEARDPKGMYAKARSGQLRNFTGIDDTYEAPASPEIVLDTMDHTAEENARSIIEHLLSVGLVRTDIHIGGTR